MVDLDAPGELGVLAPLHVGQRQVARRPIFRVAVRGDDPEDQHEAVALQVDACATLGDGAVGERASAGAVGIDEAVALVLGDPAPAAAPHRLEIRQVGVPAVEDDARGRGALRLGAVEHGAEVVVLGQAVGVLGVEAVVAHDQRLAVGPQER